MENTADTNQISLFPSHLYENRNLENVKSSYISEVKIGKSTEYGSMKLEDFGKNVLAMQGWTES